MRHLLVAALLTRCALDGAPDVGMADPVACGRRLGRVSDTAPEGSCERYSVPDDGEILIAPPELGACEADAMGTACAVVMPGQQVASWLLYGQTAASWVRDTFPLSEDGDCPASCP